LIGPGDIVTGIDALLDQGAVITGQVTGPDGSGLENYGIAFYDAEGRYVTFAFTGPGGFYETTTAVPPGDYYGSNQFRIVDQYDPVQGGYLPVAWPNVSCGEPCNFLLGAPITVTGTTPVPAIDFQLQNGSEIAGQITTGGGATPLSGVTVQLLNGDTGSVIRSLTTDTSGAYRFAGLLSGGYYLRTVNALGYGDELYAGQPCNPFCDPADGSLIELGADVTLSGFNFDLALTPTISGTVQDASGTAVGGVTVTAFDTLGSLVSTAVSDAEGAYTLRNLYAGSFFVATANNSGYVDALWQNESCAPGCDPTTGTAVPIDAGSPATGIDLILGDASAISGSVRDATGPISGVTVEVYRDTGAFVESATTGDSGFFRIQGLAAGDYHAVTRNAFGYIDEGADGAVCQSTCPPTSTGIVTVALNGESTVDFVLEFGGQVQGVVTDTAGNPLQGVSVRAFNADGVQVGTSTTGPAGAYTIGGLAGGDIFLRTANNSGYRNQRFDGLPCDALCDVRAGTAVPVVPGSVASADFALALGGSISGSVTASASAAPLVGVQVQVFDSVGLLAGFDVTGPDGAWSVTGLEDGDYRARTVNSAGYVDEVFGGDSCSPEPCTVSSGAVTTVASSNETGVNFALSLGDQISGIATDASGVPLPSGTVTVFSATGQPVKQGGIFSGSFVVNGLANGRYYLLLTNGSGLVDQLWEGLACPGGSCNVTGGTPIELGGAEVQLLASTNPGKLTLQAITDGARLGFTLDRGTLIRGSVKTETGEALKFVNVYFFDVSGVLAGRTTTDGLGNFVSEASFPNGLYYAATSAPGEAGVGNGYVDEFFDGIPCTGECDPTTVDQAILTPIGIGVDGAAPDAVNFILGTGRSVSGRVTVVESGAPLASTAITLYRSDGAIARSATSDGLGAYRFDGLLPGVYFALAAHPSGAYTSVLYDGIDCSDGACVVTDGTPIPVDSLDLTSIDFALSDGSCPFNADPEQPDSDGDGTVDACEANPPVVSDRATIGANVILGDGVEIDRGASVGVSIGDEENIPTTDIGAFSVISRDASVGVGCILGEAVVIDQGASIGRDCRIGDGTMIGRDAEIGENVQIGANTILKQQVSIGDDATIGDDVEIGRGAVIEACAFVADGTVIRQRETVTGSCN
jgi:acetyltransferase-like isoleucine patch superfamily enzyme